MKAELEKRSETRGETDEEKMIRAATLLGGIRAVDRVAKNLSSQTIAALIEFQKLDLHELFGYTRFVDFLDRSGMVEISKNEFYDRKKLYEQEGSQIYDAFNEARVPISTRKLLLENNDVPIYVDGDSLIVGETETPISNNSEIKQLVQELAAEIRQSKDALKTKENKIEKLSDQVRTGTKEFEELRRAFESANDGTKYQKSLMKAVGALIEFAVVANETPLVEKALRATDDLTALMSQMHNVRSALCQDDFIFTDETSLNGQEISPLARQAIEETGDWDDEDEQ